MKLDDMNGLDDRFVTSLSSLVGALTRQPNRNNM
jgi:hypothetical protein